MVNCGECLVNNVKTVPLVDMVCPACGADYREVRDFIAAIIVPAKRPVNWEALQAAREVSHAVEVMEWEGGAVAGQQQAA